MYSQQRAGCHGCAAPLLNVHSCSISSPVPLFQSPNCRFMHTWPGPMLAMLFIEYIFYSKNIFPPELLLATFMATEAYETEREREGRRALHSSKEYAPLHLLVTCLESMWPFYCGAIQPSESVIFFLFIFNVLFKRRLS